MSKVYEQIVKGNSNEKVLLLLWDQKLFLDMALRKLKDI